MTIDVNDIATDVDLDDELGGQTTSGITLRPRAWSSCQPARQFALDGMLKLFDRVYPAIGEAQVLAYSPTNGVGGIAALKDGVVWGAAARLYWLAMTSGSQGALFYELNRGYEKRFADEVRRLADAINKARCPDPQRRGRRSISIGRR